MKTIRIGISTIALLLAAAFVFAACSGSAPQTTEAPAAQTQQTNAVPAAPAPQQAQAATATSVPPTQPAAATATPVPSKPVATAEPQASAHASIVTPATGDEKTVPEISGIASWINSEPITFEEQRGKVVLVDFWTYTCVNCIRTLPYLKAWHEKYADKGLVIVGVHTPEFDFEKDRDNVIEATEGFGLKWPIAQDNDFKTWRAFDNRYWPAKYLVDKDGYIRYTHFGEGAYEETELWIRGLLEEAGVDLSDVSASTIPEPRHAIDLRSTDQETGLTREIMQLRAQLRRAIVISALRPARGVLREENAEVSTTTPASTRTTSLPARTMA